MSILSFKTFFFMSLPIRFFLYSAILPLMSFSESFILSHSAIKRRFAVSNSSSWNRSDISAVRFTQSKVSNCIERKQITTFEDAMMKCLFFRLFSSFRCRIVKCNVNVYYISLSLVCPSDPRLSRTELG